MRSAAQHIQLLNFLPRRPTTNLRFLTTTTFPLVRTTPVITFSRPTSLSTTDAFSKPNLNQASYIKPSSEDIQKHDADKLLEWIQQKQPGLLKDENLEKFKAAFIPGTVFLKYAGDVKFFQHECNLPIGISDQLADMAREIAGWETTREKTIREETTDKKMRVENAFKAGIKYRPPQSLVHTNGNDWVFQPHPELHKILAENVLKHFGHYKSNKIDKTYIPAYFYISGAGTGKSRNASEFAFSIQEAINTNIQHPLYDELVQRLKTSFVFHVSFENGTLLTTKEKNNIWNAVGVRMLQQLLNKPLSYISERYTADPYTIFQLVAAAEKINLFNDLTGILVIDGVQKAFLGHNDGTDKDSAFYEFLGQVSTLSLASRVPPDGERKAPFIMTCVTATHFGPTEIFLADSHRKRVYLPLKRLEPPTSKKDNLLVFNKSPTTELLMDDLGGHARAIEALADELSEYQNEPEPNITELANYLYAVLQDRYAEAFRVIRDLTFPIVQRILTRQPINPQGLIPGSKIRWEEATAPGLIWIEGDKPDEHLVAPYIWLWILARLSPSKDTKRLCEFLRHWQFNDYAELFRIKTGKGLPGNTTWQSFEVFCCCFRILRSMGFKDEKKVRLDVLHSGCKLQGGQLKVLNRPLTFAETTHKYRTSSAVRRDSSTAWSAEEVETEHNGILNADAQLSHAIVNGMNASAGDFFFSLETTQRASRRKGSKNKIIREVGQCKLIRKKWAKLTQEMYNEEREKSAGPDDFFMLYTPAESADDLVLPERSGLVDASNWDSYFGPFAGRAYLALKHGSAQSANCQT